MYFLLDTPETPVLVRTITRANGPPVTVLSLCQTLMALPAPANNRLLACTTLLFLEIYLFILVYERVYYLCACFVLFFYIVCFLLKLFLLLMLFYVFYCSANAVQAWHSARSAAHH